MIVSAGLSRGCIVFYDLLHSPFLFVKSSRDCAMSDSEPACPFSQSVGFSVIGKQSRFSRVLPLLQFCGPAAISRLVIAVIVNAINCCFRKRLWSHVSKERIEAGSPFLANCDASFPVQVLVFVVRVATPFHFTPRCVLWRIAHSARTCTVAPARLDRLPFKISPSHGSCFPALALAQPTGIAAVCLSGKLKNRQFAVDIAGFVCALFAAPARYDVARSDSATVKNLFCAAFASKQPVGSSLATKTTSGIADCREIAELLPSDVFEVGTACSRITRRHDSTPLKLDCDRAEPVHNNCLGSFHFSVT